MEKMDDIFGDLDSFGLSDTSGLELYEEEIEDKEPVFVGDKQVPFDAKTLLFDRKLICPVCEQQFIAKSIKSGKNRLLKTDLDLRAVYEKIDPMPYDVLLCNTCGYAALSKTFNTVTSYGKKFLKEKVSNQFKAKELPDIYEYDYAIERYKIALYDAVIMKVSDLEKGYLSLKIAWLYRSFGLECEQNNDLAKKNECDKNELVFLKNAREGLMKAVKDVLPPAFCIDDLTAKFLIGECSRRMGDFDTAVDWANKVIISKYPSKRLKDRARESRRLAQMKNVNEN